MPISLPACLLCLVGGLWRCAGVLPCAAVRDWGPRRAPLLGLRIAPVHSARCVLPAAQGHTFGVAPTTETHRYPHWPKPPYLCTHTRRCTPNNRRSTQSCALSRRPLTRARSATERSSSIPLRTSCACKQHRLKRLAALRHNPPPQHSTLKTRTRRTHPTSWPA